MGSFTCYIENFVKNDINLLFLNFVCSMENFSKSYLQQTTVFQAHNIWQAWYENRYKVPGILPEQVKILLSGWYPDALKPALVLVLRQVLKCWEEDIP